MYWKPPLGTQLNPAHPLSDGLVGCWVMNEGSGLYLHDYSGYGRHGIFGADDKAPTWGVSEKGSTVLFAGDDDKIVGSNFLSLSADCSLLVWFYTNTASPSYECVFNCRTSADNSDLLGFFLNANGAVHWWVGGAGGEDTPEGTYVQSQWHCVVITHSLSGVGNFYIDGRLADTAAGKTWVTASTPLLGWGRYASDTLEFFDGGITCTYLWGTKTLTPQEVQQLYIEPYTMFEQPKKYWIEEEVGVTVPVMWHHLNKNIGR